MGYQLTILADNQGLAPCLTEHGFSVLIQTPDGSPILFDVGQGNSLLHNADCLGCPLEEIDILVISHGHYDHTGALADLLSLNTKLIVYAQRGVLSTRYSLKKELPSRDISIPNAEREALLALPTDRLIWLESSVYLKKNLIGLTGPIPRSFAGEDAGGPFYFDSAGREPDLIMDETSLWIETEEGLTIITGCCHAGLINTCETIKKISGREKIHTIIGGLHLHSAGVERLEQTIDYLNREKISRLIPCHCTGNAVIELFSNRLTAEVVPGYVGLVTEL